MDHFFVHDFVYEWMASLRQYINKEAKIALKNWKVPDPLVVNTLYNALLPCVSVQVKNWKYLAPVLSLDISIVVANEYDGDFLDHLLKNTVLKAMSNINNEKKVLEIYSGVDLRETCAVTDKKTRQSEFLYNIVLCGEKLMETLLEKKNKPSIVT